ncbi:MAG: hypothetical protein AMXMBFR47_37150 [Planctomycetota bacterium]
MDRADILSKFLETLPFNPYPFQEEALFAWFESDAGVMICAPTGMGKTLIAEAAVYEALLTRKRLYYTTPLIALTDQKFREMQELAVKWGFAREDVGLITGNRRENPDAVVRVVVAEILLNHLLTNDTSVADFEDAGGVVMDEFHSFNDPERGVVWELSLTLLPRHVRVMLLSATVGNPYDFADWLKKEHGRNLTVVITVERRVPLEFVWVEDKILNEQLGAMVTDDDATNRVPALVFCFNRDECWEVAERLKGLSLNSSAQRAATEAYLAERADDLVEGVGPKLKQMLVRGVGVHHAGVLPRHREIVEYLFNRKWVPFVICTETLAAGINLPARSVVLSTLLKGKRGEKKLVPASSAHQMFGRAGRPQFDTRGFVFALAHEDDAKIAKWRQRYDQIDPHSKDPGLMRARKEMERKRPSRRKTEQYWSNAQFKQLIEAGPARLFAKSRLPYQVLIFLLTQSGALHDVRRFIDKRFNSPEHIAKFHEELGFMIENLATLGYLKKAEDGDHITLEPSIFRLLPFRSVDPLYGAFLCEHLARGDDLEKLIALESALELPTVLLRKVRLPWDLPKGPLQQEVIEPMLIAKGLMPSQVEDADADEEGDFFDDEEEPPRPPSFPEMLDIAFQSLLASPERVTVQPKWVAGPAFEMNGEFFKYVKSRDLIKQEGLILRHLLRLVILAGEFFAFTEDPAYQTIAEKATRCCHRVDPTYTDRFLAEAVEMRKVQVLKGA